MKNFKMLSVAAGAMMLIGGSAKAADLYTPMPEPAPVYTGGWYFSAFGGANWLDKTSFDIDPGVPVRNSYDTGYVVGGAVGYDFGQAMGPLGMRIEGEVSYRNNSVKSHAIDGGAPERGPGGHRPDISIDLSHADIDVLARAGEDFFTRLETFEAVRDVNDNYDPGKAQLNFTLLPEGHALGLTPADVGRQVRDAFFGAVAMRHLRGTNEIEIRVKLPEEERKDMRYLDDFVVRTPDGVEVPLMSVVEVNQGEAFRSIGRRDGRRVITISAKIEPKSASVGGASP